MNKLFRNAVGTILGIAMAAGVGVAIGSGGKIYSVQAATDHVDDVVTFGSTIPSGWTVHSSNTHVDNYLKMSDGDYIETTSSSTLFASNSYLSSETFSVAASCGTFGTWTSGKKAVKITAQLLKSDETVLSSGELTTGQLGNKEGAYQDAISLDKPTDPTQISKFRIIFSDFETSGAVLRVKNLNLNYSEESSSQPTSNPTSQPTSEPTSQSTSESTSTSASTSTSSSTSLSATYDFVTEFSTYAATWGGYASHEISGSDVSAAYEALVSFTNVSKQSGSTSSITDRPVIAAKSGTTSTMTFVLDSTVSENYKITSVSVALKQWGSKKLAVAMYKGTSVSGTALDSFTANDTPRTLTTSNLNGDAFIVDFSTTNSSNVQLGITSISIELAAKASFGTLHHIKVTSKPTTSIYHVDEYFNPTGLQVTAYDGENESKATYKDVTNSIVTLLDNTYQFVSGDVPGLDVDVSYSENNITKETSYHLDVYSKAEYQLVESEPTDWSGNYLLVGSYTDSNSVSHTVAMNSALVNFDQPLNFKEVTISNNKITTGQECEFVVASYSDGYSMQGKNSKYAYGNSSNRFMTSESAQQLSFEFGNSNYVTITGESGTNSYVLVFSSAASGAERFGFYKNASSSLRLFKLVESSLASDYADEFLGTLKDSQDPICQVSGNTVLTDFDDLKAAWELLAGDYATLTPADKEQFRLGSASETGTNIQQALALYDHIATSYGTRLQSQQLTNYNFMGRNITPVNSKVVLSEVFDTTNISMIVIIISIIGMTTVGGYFFLRKRKEQ